MRLVVCSVLFSYIKRSKAGDCVQSQLTNLFRIKEPRTRVTRHESAKSLRPGQSLIFSPRHGHCVVFCVNFFLKVFGSGQSDVRSETSMTTCCVLNANMDSGEPSSQNCMTKHGSSYPQIVYCLRVSGVWNYPVDERI